MSFLSDDVRNGKYTLSQLFQLLDEEKQALSELKSYGYYDDRARQISATRENIDAIWDAIHKIRGKR